jgi:hypothetical protein
MEDLHEAWHPAGVPNQLSRLLPNNPMYHQGVIHISEASIF